jgi:hypothetical protein
MRCININRRQSKIPTSGMKLFGCNGMSEASAKTGVDHKRKLHGLVPAFQGTDFRWNK